MATYKCLTDLQGKTLKYDDVVILKDIKYIVQYAVDEAKLQLQSDILATEKSLASKKAELEDAKCSVPLNSSNIVNLQIEVESLEDGLKRLNALKKEFGF